MFGCVKKDFVCAVISVRLLYIRWHDTTSEDREDFACPGDLRSV
jgi:hypothetical protein